MRKLIAAIVGCVLLFGGTMAFVGVTQTNNNRKAFETDGYVLERDMGELKQLRFDADAPYLVSNSGLVTFEDASGTRSTVSRENFVHLSNNSIMALADGILLDLNDLSDNFINNYYIAAGLPISASGDVYRAETSSGSVEFGENVWKLSDQKYIVRASSLSVHLSDDDVHETEDYVQVSTDDDGIVHLLTQEGMWATISDDSYIETSGGVQIYPVPQLVDNGSYKLSVAKLSVAPDDAIVLTEAETRRQIVPELNIETIDGEDGTDGEAGAAGQNGDAGAAGVTGENGEDGEGGQDGQSGATGETGAAGSAGLTGTAGAAGSAGARGSGGADGDGGNPGVSAAASSNKGT